MSHMIVVTGGAGFIGSNLVHALNGRGREDLLVVDQMDDVRKVANLATSCVADYLDRDEFLTMIDQDHPDLGDVDLVLHQGARTSTTDDDARAVLEANFRYSKHVHRWCTSHRVPLIYASSAAVYGASLSSDEAGPPSALNVYAWSKQLFDEYVRRRGTTDSQVVGLRYFNVYGPREDHKGEMASMVAQMDQRCAAGAPIRLFGDGCGRPAGEHRRDFVHVDDVVRVVLWFAEHPEVSGLFNCATGESRSFNELAAEVMRFHGAGSVEYVPFPTALVGRYQAETRADLTRLRAAGYDDPFTPIEAGVPTYLKWRRSQETQ